MTGPGTEADGSPESDAPDPVEPGVLNGRRPRPWEALVYRDYRILWLTHLTQTVATQVRILAIIAWIYETTGSATLAGMIGLVQLVVQTPMLLLGGTLADQLDRKQMMIVANSSTTVIFGVMAVMAVMGMLEPWHVYTGVALAAATTVLGGPSRAALVPLTVPRHLVMLAVSTDTATQNAGSILGPAIFGLVAWWLGIPATFVAVTLFMIPATILPLFLQVRGRAEGQSAGTTIRRTIDGFVYTVRHPILPGLFLLDTGVTVVSFYREILPVLASGLFRSGSAGAGILGAAGSAGAILGSFLAVALSGYRKKGMLALYATLAYGVILFGFASVPSLWFGALMIAGLGGSDSVTVAVRTAMVHLTTPDAMRGRAYSFLTLSAMAANNIGTLWVGVWVGLIGAQSTMLLGGILSILATLVIWRVWRPIREFTYP